MAYPSIASYLTGNLSVNGTSSSIIAPSGTVSGDLMVLIITKDGTGTFTTPSGWTSLANTSYSAQCVGIFYRKLTASLSNFTIVHASEMTSWIILRIPNGDTPQISVRVDGSSATPNPGSLTHSFGAGTEVLWIACAGWDYNRTCSAYPSTFPNDRYNSRCTSTSGTGTAMATLSSTTNPQDPGTFTISATDTWSAYTLAIRTAGPPIVTGSTEMSGSDLWNVVSSVSPSGSVSMSGSCSMSITGKKLGVTMSIDAGLALRIVGTIIEGASVGMNSDGDLTVVELIEGEDFYLNSDGTLIIGELLDGQI